MASHQNDAVFPEEDIDDDDETLEDEEEEEEDDDVVLREPDDDDEIEPSPSTSSALAAVTVAAIRSTDTASILTATTTVAGTSPKRQRSEQIEEKKALDDSRRLFQRLWTDEDEIGLLQGFLEYTTQRGSSHHNDTALFYDQIKSKLQLGFNKNQLVEKLRRLKKKYRNVLNKISSGKEFSFKSPHDQATFEISRRIWSNTAPITGPVEDDDEINPNSNPNPNLGHSMKNEARTTPSRKRSRSRSEKREMNEDYNCINNNNDNNNNNNNNKDNENCNGRNSVQGLIEETVRGCLTPVLKELLVSGGMGLGSTYGFGGRGFGVGGFTLPMPLSFMNLGIGEMNGDEKWRKQQILELEVYSKRLELVQDQIKVALEELRSAGAGRG